MIIGLRFPNVKIGKGIRIYGKLILSIDKSATVVIGDNVIFRSSTKHNFVGLNKPVSICVLPGATLLIGDNSGFSGNSIYVAQKIQIGRYCNIGGNSAIWDTDFHPIDFLQRRTTIEGTKTRPIVIGNDVFLGANSMVLKGVEIGQQSVIGAGSVVSKNVPPHQIWAGNPIVYIKDTN